jgi:hypothetical protein
MENIKKHNKLLDYNKVVIESYNQVISNVKELILNLEDESLRVILERQDEPKDLGGYIVHELINSLIYIRLECLKGNMYAIHYGYEQSDLILSIIP